MCLECVANSRHIHTLTHIHTFTQNVWTCVECVCSRVVKPIAKSAGPPYTHLYWCFLCQHFRMSHELCMSFSGRELVEPENLRRLHNHYYRKICKSGRLHTHFWYGGAESCECVWNALLLYRALLQKRMWHFAEYCLFYRALLQKSPIKKKHIPHTDLGFHRSDYPKPPHITFHSHILQSHSEITFCECVWNALLDCDWWVL